MAIANQERGTTEVRSRRTLENAADFQQATTDVIDMDSSLSLSNLAWSWKTGIHEIEQTRGPETLGKPEEASTTMSLAQGVANWMSFLVTYFFFATSVKGSLSTVESTSGKRPGRAGYPASGIQ